MTLPLNTSSARAWFYGTWYSGAIRQNQLPSPKQSDEWFDQASNYQGMKRRNVRWNVNGNGAREAVHDGESGQGGSMACPGRFKVEKIEPMLSFPGHRMGAIGLQEICHFRQSAAHHAGRDSRPQAGWAEARRRSRSAALAMAVHNGVRHGGHGTGKLVAADGVPTGKEAQLWQIIAIHLCRSGVSRWQRLGLLIPRGLTRSSPPSVPQLSSRHRQYLAASMDVPYHWRHSIHQYPLSMAIFVRMACHHEYLLFSVQFWYRLFSPCLIWICVTGGFLHYWRGPLAVRNNNETYFYWIIAYLYPITKRDDVFTRSGMIMANGK